MSSIFELFGTIALNTGGAEKQLAKISAAGKKVGSVLGKGFKVAGEAALQMGKVIGAGVAAGTTAMGKLASSAMSAYASYEQLEGGVKKLFGDDAQNLVMEYARNAYRTAGLSANEYMDTVTSFSASLISSLGKDTVAAAAYADLAITDMADNANTFGTSMEDIQNAYKGFSKQNYTMLDNLKLGYGGTQKEMERLLADASKLSGVKYKIENFSDIIEAIHVIQDNQGIAGTTAAEAEKTISGSVNAAKAAWKNLLSGLADGEQDIDQLVSNLSETVLTAAQKNIVPRLQTMAPRLVQAAQTLVSTLGPQLPGIINTILPSMIEAATTLIGGLADVLPDLLGSIIDVLPNVVKQIGGALKKLFPSLLKTVKSLIGKIDFKGLGQAIGSGLRSIVTNLPQILSDIGNAIKWAWENIAYPLIQGIFKGIFGIDLPDWDKVAESISDWWEDVKTAVGGALEIAFKAVESAVSTAKATVERWWGKVKAAAWNVMKIMFRLDDAKLRDAVDKIKGFWKDVVAEIGNTLALMWHLLNPLNIARQVRNAWNTATSGLNLTVRYNVIKNAVPAAIEDALNPDAPTGSLTTPTVSGIRGAEIINSIINPFAHADGAIFSKPTLFDTSSGYHLVGEAGAEAVAPIGVLQGYVKSAVGEVVGASMERKLDQMLAALQNGFSGMNQQQIVLDTGVLVGATAGKMDKRLGRMALRKGRNA
ncbi:MAG: hypothetical protein EGP83_07170 [Clostridiales bacterium]|nr:hypothetical protein [Clostridiales bacterium]